LHYAHWAPGTGRSIIRAGQQAATIAAEEQPRRDELLRPERHGGLIGLQSALDKKADAGLELGASAVV
jgi:hypothetical protein